MILLDKRFRVTVWHNLRGLRREHPAEFVALVVAVAFVGACLAGMVWGAIQMLAGTQ